MELIQKSLPTKFKNFVIKINDDNLFMLASSISYYSAVAIAPFLLILLGVASFMGKDVQQEIVTQSYIFSPEVGRMVSIIIDNVNEGINLGSISGIVGVCVLLFTASLVFLQMRYSLDMIYGHHIYKGRKSIWETIFERIFAMFVVIVAGLVLIISSSIPGLIRVFLGHDVQYQAVAFLINFIVYIGIFWCIHYFTPSERPGKRDALKMSVLSALFFIIGNVLLGYYFRGVATSSIYGAAASLLIFLIWTYYSSFTMFLSVELFLFLRKVRKVKA